jgi:hypothetical protein
VLSINPCVRMCIKCCRSPTFYMENAKFNLFVKLYGTYFSFKCALIRTVLADKSNNFHTSPCRLNLGKSAPDTHCIWDLSPRCSTASPPFCPAATRGFQLGAWIGPLPPSSTEAENTVIPSARTFSRRGANLRLLLFPPKI